MSQLSCKQSKLGSLKVKIEEQTTGPSERKKNQTPNYLASHKTGTLQDKIKENSSTAHADEYGPFNSI